MTEELTVETTGETVGEAKWAALRELELRHPGLDKAAVRFEVVAEGERGLLGVGYEPARVLAHLPAEAAEAVVVDESEQAGAARLLVARVLDALGVEGRLGVHDGEDAVTVTCSGADVALLIGRHGQTIDAVQHLAFKVANRGAGRDEAVRVTVDAAGYRERREQMLHRQADQAASRAAGSGRPVALDAMSATERKVVHEYLKDREDVETYSEGTEPDRHLVVAPLD